MSDAESFRDWDTFGFFEQLLAEFPSILKRTQRIHLAHSSYSDLVNQCLQAAIVGFSLYQEVNDWNSGLTQWIVERVEVDFTQEDNFLEEFTESSAQFTFLTLGAMQARYADGELDDRDFLLGDFHLTSFVMNNLEQIASKYEAFRDTQSKERQEPQ